MNAMLKVDCCRTELLHAAHGQNSFIHSFIQREKLGVHASYKTRPGPVDSSGKVPTLTLLNDRMHNTKMSKPHTTFVWRRAVQRSASMSPLE